MFCSTRRPYTIRWAFSPHSPITISEYVNAESGNQTCASSSGLLSFYNPAPPTHLLYQTLPRDGYLETEASPHPPSYLYPPPPVPIPHPQRTKPLDVLNQHRHSGRGSCEGVSQSIALMIFLYFFSTAGKVKAWKQMF